MSAVVHDILKWSATRDQEGHREYKITFLASTDDPDDGPATLLSASGLPTIGSAWGFGNDIDPWALCWPNATITPMVNNEPNQWWYIEQMFTTKPIWRCQSATIDNPLDEPVQVSGSFVKYVAEAEYDRNGDAITNSSHQPYTGAVVEVDHNRPTVNISKNFSSNQLSVFASMVDTVNDATLWGLPARRVKLANVSWERKYYGVCTAYYTANYEFEIRYEGFDKIIADKGTHVYIGSGNTNDPANYILNVDIHGNPKGIKQLDGSGSELAHNASPYFHTFEIYRESNFLLLGIPTSL